MRKLIERLGVKLLNWSRLSVHFDHSEGTWYIENLYVNHQRRLFKKHKLVAKVWFNRGLRAKLDNWG